MRVRIPPPRPTINASLITSQFDTAPKRAWRRYPAHYRLITSQFDTAPKLGIGNRGSERGLITSQFDTAPKLKPRLNPF